MADPQTGCGSPAGGIGVWETQRLRAADPGGNRKSRQIGFEFIVGAETERKRGAGGAAGGSIAGVGAVGTVMVRSCLSIC